MTSTKQTAWCLCGQPKPYGAETCGEHTVAEATRPEPVRWSYGMAPRAPGETDEVLRGRIMDHLRLPPPAPIPTRPYISFPPSGAGTDTITMPSLSPLGFRSIPATDPWTLTYGSDPESDPIDTLRQGVEAIRQHTGSARRNPTLTMEAPAETRRRIWEQVTAEPPRFIGATGEVARHAAKKAAAAEAPMPPEPTPARERWDLLDVDDGPLSDEARAYLRDWHLRQAKRPIPVEAAPLWVRQVVRVQGWRGEN